MQEVIRLTFINLYSQDSIIFRKNNKFKNRLGF